MKRVLLVLSVVAGVAAVAAGAFYMNRPVVTFSPRYPPMTLEERSKTAAVIVEGTVVSRGTSQRTKIPTAEPPGSFSEYPETPVKVRVDESLKGAKVGDVITYWEPGGAFLTQMIVTESQPLKPGEKVILFLTKQGHSEGNPIEAVLRVVEGKISRKAQEAQDAREYLARVKELIR